MPDKRSPPTEADSIDTRNGADLIAQRDSIRKTAVRGRTQSYTSTVELDADVAQWVEDSGPSVSATLEMEKVRRDNTNVYAGLMAFASDWNRLRVLHALVEHRLGVGYETLDEYANVSRRTLRKYLNRLDELGVLETEGNPKQFRLKDDTAHVLALDVASFV